MTDSLLPVDLKADLVSAQVEAIVLNKIAADKLIVPALPEVASHCIGLLRDPNLAVRALVPPLERDPALTVQILRIANSAAYGGTGSVRTIEQAVSRLGHHRLKTVIVEASAARLFTSRDPRISQATTGLWQHSAAVALLARDLAALSGQGDADAAYLAGLLHDVGKPIAATILLEAEKQLAARSQAPWLGVATWLAVIRKVHHAIGVALAEKWNLPEEVRVAVRDCSDYDSTSRKSGANYVRFANAMTKTMDLYVGETDIEDARALVMVGRSLLDLDDEVIKRLTGDLDARVRRTMQ